MDPGARPSRRLRRGDTSCVQGTRATGWIDVLGSNPVPWLLASGEPSARWLALTALLDRPPDDPDVVDVHAAVLADSGTADLIGRLPDWEAGGPIPGHDSPSFAPNVLGLLADMGLAAGDSPVVDGLLEAMLRHQDGSGRFATYATSRIGATPAWGALLCDTHAITDVLARYGRAAEPAAVRALERMAADLAPTSAGIAWPCIPSLGFRGPGRKGDPCPQVSLEALRAIARAACDPAGPRHPDAMDAARTVLTVWRGRASSQPYMFGHGYAFKTVKWPPFWYSALTVLDAVGRFPALWRGPGARADDRRSIAELAACLVAYNVDPDGRVTPRSCCRGFERFSFGQKQRPSPFATAVVAAALRRVDDLAGDIAAVDVLGLGSSKGGSGTPRPPRPPRSPSTP